MASIKDIRLGQYLWYCSKVNKWDIDTISKVIRNSSEIDVDEDGRTFLHLAYYYSTPTDVFQMVVDAYPSKTFSQDDQGNTPMHWAVSKNKEEYVNALLQAAPSVISIEDLEGLTPVHLAFRYVSPKVILMLLRNNPSSRLLLRRNKRRFIKTITAGLHNEIREFLDSIRIEATPSEILEMSFWHNRRNKYYRDNAVNVRELYEVLCILLREDANNHGNDNDWMALHTSLKDNSCSWILCEFILRLTPDQIAKEDHNNNLPIVFLSHDSMKVFYNYCNNCHYCSCNKKFFECEDERVLCEKCKTKTNKSDDMFREFDNCHLFEMEKVRMIYSMLQECPQICAVTVDESSPS